MNVLRRLFHNQFPRRAALALGLALVTMLAHTAFAGPAQAEDAGLKVPFRGRIVTFLPQEGQVLIQVGVDGGGVVWVLAPAMDLKPGQGLEIDAGTVYSKAYQESTGLAIDRLAVATHGVLQGRDIRISGSEALPAGWTAADPG